MRNILVAFRLVAKLTRQVLIGLGGVFSEIQFHEPSGKGILG